MIRHEKSQVGRAGYCRIYYNPLSLALIVRLCKISSSDLLRVWLDVQHAASSAAQQPLQL